MSDLDLSTIAAERLAIVRDVMTNERHDVWSEEEFDAWIASVAAQVREQAAKVVLDYRGPNIWATEVARLIRGEQ